MVDVFWGEFFFHPCALDINFNTCGNGCCYCYANAKKVARRSRLVQIRNMVESDPHDPKLSFRNRLYHMGYPVSMCNETDVLQKHNLRETFAVLSLLSRKNTPVFCLTKGGSRDDEDELIARLADKGNSLLYVSLTSVDDDISRRIEPNAPPTSHRLDLIRRAADKGLFVEVGLNPLLKTWIPEARAMDFVASCVDAGAGAFVTHALHLGREQAASDKVRSAMTEEDMAAAQDREDALVYAMELGMAIADAGLPVHSPALPRPSTITLVEEAVLGKTMPSAESLVFYAEAARKEEGGEIELTFDDFANALFVGKEELLPLRTDFYHVIFSYCRATWRHNQKAQRCYSFRDLARFVWNDRRMGAICPMNNFAFRTVVGDDGKPAVDDDGDVVLRYDGLMHADKDDRVTREGR